jgi:O-antigen/teichoic acid export membrane protein
MDLDLKRFFRHTAVYMAGNLLYRGGAFVLLPLYTRVLTPTDYGTLELIAVAAALFQTLLSSGIAHATLRFYFEYPDERDRNAIVSTALILSFVVSVIAACVLCLAAPSISSFVFGGPVHTFALRIVFVTMVFEISREINLAFVRARERSTFFVIMSITQLVVQVSANVFTVWYMRWGITGVLLGNLTATTAIWIVLSRATIATCGWRVEPRKMVAVLKYGAPLMASSIFDSGVRSVDRYLLNAYTSLSVVGLCALAMKVASIPVILIIQPFSNSYGPFRFAVMNQPDAGTIYARVFRYYVFVASFVVLGLSLLSREILTVVAGPDYLQSYRLVPLFLLAGAAGGVGYCFQTGMYIKKRTDYQLYSVIAGGALYLLLIRLLVPRMGAQGVAVASVVQVIFSTSYFYLVSQPLFRIDYQLGRAARIVVPAVVLGAAAALAPWQSPWIIVPLKLLAVAVYPVAVWLAGGITQEEIDGFKSALRGLRTATPSAAPAVPAA